MKQELDTHLHAMARTLRQVHAFTKSFIRGHGKQYAGYALKELEKFERQRFDAARMLVILQNEGEEPKDTRVNSMEDIAFTFKGR